MSLWGKIKKAAKKVVRVVKRAVKTVVRVVKLIGNRALGILGFIGSLLGIRPTKFLRLKVWILKNEKGLPIIAESVAQQWVDEAKRIFKDRASIEIHAANQRREQIVNVLAEQPPNFALKPDISNSDMLTEEVDWFDERRNYARTSIIGQFLADFLGYGEPIFAFAVEDITSDSQPLGVANTLWNFCVVAQDAKLSTLAHELGHMCGLLHRSNVNNLMTPGRTDDRLTRWQISVIRNSRFVTFFRT